MQNAPAAPLCTSLLHLSSATTNTSDAHMFACAAGEHVRKKTNQCTHSTWEVSRRMQAQRKGTSESKHIARTTTHAWTTPGNQATHLQVSTAQTTASTAQGPQNMHAQSKETSMYLSTEQGHGCMLAPHAPTPTHASTAHQSTR